MAQLTDGSEYPELVNRMKYIDKHANVGLEDILMDQAMRDKLGKNKSWFVCKSWTDHENKRFSFECEVGKDAEVRHISFDDALEILNWKSFEFLDDNLHVKFVPWKFEKLTSGRILMEDEYGHKVTVPKGKNDDGSVISNDKYALHYKRTA